MKNTVKQKQGIKCLLVTFYSVTRNVLYVWQKQKPLDHIHALYYLATLTRPMGSLVDFIVLWKVLGSSRTIIVITYIIVSIVNSQTKQSRETYNL